MSGRILDEVKPLLAPIEKLKTLQVFISHGVNDEVLTIQYAREAEAFLKSKEVHPVYHEYSAGHTINAEMLSDLITWLERK
jgi:phospholipase/carboxylesterase